MHKPSARKQNSTHWAVWTIALGAVLACVMPWALTHFYTGITFPATSHISDNIGGIAGPILNFVGLLVVYFSLREQFNANQIQLRNFKKEQRRNSNENTISTAFKILDDLRTEARRLTDDSVLLSALPSHFKQYINSKKYPDFEEVNYHREPQLLDYQFDLDEASAPKTVPYDLHREIEYYFLRLAQHTKVLSATCNMLIYLLDRSQLPLSQRLHFYTILQAIYEPLLTTLLDNLEVLRDKNAVVDDLVKRAWYLREKLDNGREAYVDLVVHNPERNW
jgi:hypothetical protein